MQRPRVSAAAMRVEAPAKINLSLAIVGKRPDGFHELVTLFERLDLADEIWLEPRDAGITCHCDVAGVPTDARNLVVQAAQRIQAQCGISRGVAITIRKRVPVGSGLGGGSSDAAAVLKGLSALWQLQLSQAELVRLGRQLGSDIPVFLHDSAWAVGLGRGDVVLPLPGVRRTVWHVLVSLPVELSTARVYDQWDQQHARARETGQRPISDVVQGLIDGAPLALLGPMLTNDLTPAAQQLEPQMREVETHLRRAGASWVLMSGSGPTLAALSDDEHDARAIAAAMTQQRPAARVTVARTAI